MGPQHHTPETYKVNHFISDLWHQNPTHVKYLLQKYLCYHVTRHPWARAPIALPTGYLQNGYLNVWLELKLATERITQNLDHTFVNRLWDYSHNSIPSRSAINDRSNNIRLSYLQSTLGDELLCSLSVDNQFISLSSRWRRPAADDIQGIPTNDII